MITLKRIINYYETDRMGITHHSNYIRIMEEARVAFLDQIGYGFDKMEAEGVVSPVVSVNLEYKKPTSFHDEIEVDVKVKELTPLKLTFEYLIKANGVLACKGQSVHCFTENGRFVTIENRWPELANKLKELL